jgi:hypothetical protein
MWSITLSRRNRPSCLAPLLALLVALPALAGSPLEERLEERALAAVHQSVHDLRERARPVHARDWEDVRCVFHAHSQLSHDSQGTEKQIVAGAKAAGVRAVFMTEHPTPDRKWVTEGLRGEKDGVLLVPGAELSDGLLVWRGERAEWTPEMKAGEVLERLQRTDAVAFVAHPEKRKDDADWKLPRFDGMEIYNSHADAEDSGYEKTLQSLRGASPFKILGMLNTLKKYPREAYAAIFDEPVEVLKRWDTLNASSLAEGRRVVGIAGNDSHQNVGISIEAGESSLIVKNALGKVVGDLSRKSLGALLLGALAPGSVVLAQNFDPYDVSFGYVSTHLLAREATEDALFEALLQGRAYVAFDWMADPTGFRYFAKTRKKQVEMGGDVRAKDHPLLTVRPNMECEIRLLRNGEEVRRAQGTELTFEAREPGVYRAEAWVRVAGEPRPWIYSNPVYVLPKE